MNEDPFDATRIAPRREPPVDDATQVAAPRVPKPKPVPEVDPAEDLEVDLPREHYGIRQAPDPQPVPLLTSEEPSTAPAVIPALDVEGASARARRARLGVVIGLVAAMVVVVVLAGIGLSVLL